MLAVPRVSTSRLTTLVCMLAALSVAPAAAQQPPAVDDFVALCPAAVLAPDSFDQRLAASGYSAQESREADGLTGTNYVHADSGDSLQVIVQDFSDATSRTCTLISAQGSADTAWFETAKQQLEAAMGALEGRVITEGSFSIGYYKAEGVDPLVTVNVVVTESVINLTLNAWTFSP